MMFFKISSVPAAIREPGVDSTESWNAARIGTRSGSLTIPPMSMRSMAKAAMSCAWAAATSLPIEFSGPGVSPRESAVITRKRVQRRPCRLTYQSASRSRTPASASAGPSSSSVARATA